MRHRLVIEKDKYELELWTDGDAEERILGLLVDGRTPQMRAVYQGYASHRKVRNIVLTIEETTPEDTPRS